MIEVRLVGGHASVHRLDDVVAQCARAKCSRRVVTAASPAPGVLDRRQHHERLLAPRQSSRHEVVHGVELARGDHAGVDGFAPGKASIDRRDIEIAQHGERERSGNRRGGYDQGVGGAVLVFALASQRRSLVHAEAMLFVGDRHRKVMELDRFGEQGRAFR